MVEAYKDLKGPHSNLKELLNDTIPIAPLEMSLSNSEKRKETERLMKAASNIASKLVERYGNLVDEGSGHTAFKVPKILRLTRDENSDILFSGSNYYSDGKLLRNNLSLSINGKNKSSSFNLISFPFAPMTYITNSNGLSCDKNELIQFITVVTSFI